jgi:hypothetical protein
MEHSEHYSQYLHAFSCAMLGQGASVFSPDGDAKPYLAVALGVVAARRDSDFLNLEEFCEAMATNLRITPKVDAAPVCPVDAPPPRIAAGIGPGGTGTDYCAIVSSGCPAVPPCQACYLIASTCKQLGNGEDYCNFIMADCLCRAADHDLNIDA